MFENYFRIINITKDSLNFIIFIFVSTSIMSTFTVKRIIRFEV